jgi:hypothetical protein
MMPDSTFGGLSRLAIDPVLKQIQYLMEKNKNKEPRSGKTIARLKAKPSVTSLQIWFRTRGYKKRSGVWE